MKRLMLIIFAVSTLMVAQDATGSYKLTGVDVLYTFVSRAENVLTVSDPYGLGPAIPIATIPANVPFTTQAMQLDAAALAGLGINLNVTLNVDGTGSIAAGSYYPDVNTDQDGETCVTFQDVLPVTDNFSYSSKGDMMDSLGIVHPGVNVLGIPGVSKRAGQQLGGLGLSGSNTFENYPKFPENPVLCGPDGTCIDFTVGDCGFDQDDDDGDGNGMEVECCSPGDGLDGGNCGDGEIQFAHEGQQNDLGFSEYIAGGLPLTGVTAGYFLKRGLNTDDLSSVFDGTYGCNAETGANCTENTTPDFYLEWHGIDGAASGLGCGSEEDCTNDVLTDEDGEDGYFDRLIGIPDVTATYMNPACGFNYPIFGDVSAQFEAAGQGACVDHVGSAVTGYLMDPTGASAAWGNFATAHAALMLQCVDLLGEVACAGLGGGVLMQDDSGFDMDPACLADYDGNPANFTNLLDCAGRIPMNFDADPCIGIVEAREVVAEFIEVNTGECGSGDINNDGGQSVLDVVALVNCILDSNCPDCSGDMNLDGGINVMDVVALVNCILNECGAARVDSATSAEFNVLGNEVTFTANGAVGGIQMTLSHGNDFSLELTDNGQFSDYSTEGNTTTLIIVNPENNNLFSANNDFTIESIIVSDYNGENQISSSVNILRNYSISAAYPNPFNPTTQMSLTLNTATDVSVEVYNMNGQLIDVMANGQMSSGTYNLTWDGTNAASGVYFIQSQIGFEMHTQKIMLIK